VVRVNGLPWGRPRHELLLLALVAVAALSPVHAPNSQDQSRLCLTRALVHGHLSNDGCLATSGDRAVYKGHLYSDKAPGMSALELPVAEAVRVPAPSAWPSNSPQLWAIRLFSSGIAFLVCAFLVGRVSEGIAPGLGGISLVTFALGTLVAPFAVANFDHVPSAALGFGAFVLAWRRSPLLAGVVAGVAVTVDYEAAATLAILGAYVAFQGRGPLLRFASGTLPGIALLGVYGWLAFGAPWRVSYRYVTDEFPGQASGFFGISLPSRASIHEVLIGHGGLLIISPVVVAAGWGLVLLARRYPAEATVCAAVTLFFVILNGGYYLPYGGISPGPRFLIPALPFLAVGLATAFARYPRLTALLAAVSVVAMTGVLLTWSISQPDHPLIWNLLAHLPLDRGSSRFVSLLTFNVFCWLGLSRGWAAGLVALCAPTAFIVALVPLTRMLAASSRPATDLDDA
jgi:hypothetical protein